MDKSTYKFNLNYMHPIAKEISRFEKEMDTKDVCSTHLKSLENGITKYGNGYINSFCKGNKIVLDYIA